MSISRMEQLVNEMDQITNKTSFEDLLQGLSGIVNTLANSLNVMICTVIK